MRVTVTRTVARPGISARRLKDVVAQTLRLERMPRHTAVSVVLVGDPTIKQLNRKFLRADRATDVLSFSMQGTRPAVGKRALYPSVASGRGRGYAVGEDEGEVLGEIIISVDRARAQARRAGHGVRAEVALLAVHGVLHLTGYDDASAAQAARMDRRQRRILRILGEEVRA